MGNLCVLCLLRELPDPLEAAKWCRMAAERGDISAQRTLGVMLFSGLGVPEDRGEARHWLSKAAEQGDRQSANLLVLLSGETNSGPEIFREGDGETLLLESPDGDEYSPTLLDEEARVSAATNRAAEVTRLGRAAEGSLADVALVKNGIEEVRPLVEARIRGTRRPGGDSKRSMPTQGRPRRTSTMKCGAVARLPSGGTSRPSSSSATGIGWEMA